MVDQLEPELRRRLRDARNPERQRLAARLLYAARPDAEARAVLLAGIERALDLPELPDLHEHKSAHDRPDHGWAPWPCYDINLLAQHAELELIGPLQRLATRIAPDPARSDKHYHYLESIAYAVERIADPAGVQIVCDLLDRPCLQNRLLMKDDDPRRRADHVRDRYAYLRLSLARALARCGDERGYDALTQFLGDQRPWLARAAHAELRDLAAENSCDRRSVQPYRAHHR